MVIDLRAAVEDVLSFHSAHARSKGLDLTWEVSEEVPSVLRGDPRSLRQVLSNLIGNAVKFTEEGSVAVHVSLVDQLADAVTLRIEVSDTGIGIPEEAQPRLFEAFSQADGSLTRRHGGTGLGLAIARKLVESMGGRISFWSEVGRGSRFSFTATFQSPSRTLAAGGSNPEHERSASS